MLYLVTGASASGKSEYAENLARQCHLARPAGRLFYVATMYPCDEECHARIRKHRLQRQNKGFDTVECYVEPERIAADREDVLLLECMSNLLANEMYLPKGRIRERGSGADAQNRSAIIEPVLQLADRAGDLIVVTNEVFSDGIAYDGETREYIRLLGQINVSLAKRAQQVTEVVCGIPLQQKGGGEH